MIRKDLSHMNYTQPTVENNRRLFLPRIVEYWEQDREAPSNPEGTRWRGSQAASCARQVAYATAGSEETNPPGLADKWRMGLGSTVHEIMAPAMERWAGKDSSLKIIEEWETPLGEHGYGHADMLIETAEGQRILFELKTINGFGYKQSVENDQGPRWSAILQGSMYAHAAEADLLVIGYLAMELISPGRAAAKGIDEVGRFASEWHYTKDQFTPWAEAEIARLEGITSAVHDDGVPAHEIPRRFSHYDPDIPFGAEITAPSNGKWMLRNEENAVIDSGTAWQCRYCRFQDLCVKDNNETAF